MENTKLSRVEQMEYIQKKCLEIFKKKNHDYGDAFARFGVVGVLMRIEDKLQRLRSIDKKGVQLVDDESMKDTLLDLHNYAAMGLILMNE